MVWAAGLIRLKEIIMPKNERFGTISRDPAEKSMTGGMCKQ